MAARREITKMIAKRYAQASKKEKGQSPHDLAARYRVVP